MWRRRSRVANPDWNGVLTAGWGRWSVMSSDEREHLVALAERFVRHHRIEGVRGFEVGAEMRILIAAQACLLLMGWDLDPEGPLEPFERTGPVIVHPSTVVLGGERRLRGDIGQMTTDSPEAVGGLAHLNGPVVISWRQARAELRRRISARNVILHEFAHQLDMYDGVLDGVASQIAVGASRERFVQVCSRVHAAMAAGDTEVPRVEAASDPGEFFAVVTEEFFGRPDLMALHQPELFEVFAELYRQDWQGRLDTVVS